VNKAVCVKSTQKSGRYSSLLNYTFTRPDSLETTAPYKFFTYLL